MKKHTRLIELLPVILTDDERARKAIDLAALSTRIEEADQRKKDITKQLAADVANLEIQARGLALVVNQGYEMRDVECELRFDWSGRAAYVVRLDTAEEIRRRPMTEAELQRELPLEP